MENLSDKELIREYFKTGEEQFLSELFGRYLKQTYSFIYAYVGDREDAVDIVQDSFFLAWKNLKKFDVDRSFRNWIFTIAKNTAINWLKKKKPIRFSELEREEEDKRFEDSLESAEALPDLDFERKEERERLTGAIDRLNPKQKVVLLMHLGEDLTFEEIGRILDESLNTVKSRYRRALIGLRNILLGAPK